MLAHEAAFNDRSPEKGDAVSVGIIRLEHGNAFEVLGKTNAWNWQQGSMLQWHPADPERLMIHNDRRDDHYVGVVRGVDGREVNVYDRPIYAAAPDGRQALSLNFSRLHDHRPGYGYAGVADAWRDEKQPEDDGIYLINLDSGDSALIISLHQLATNRPTRTMKDVFHWVNHVQISPDGGRFSFFHLWRVGTEGWGVRLYVADLDGSNLQCVLDSEMISHYDWMDERTILVWAKLVEFGAHFIMCDVLDGSKRVVGEGTLSEDGHCSFSPDGKWVLNDTYPDRFGMRTLMLFRMSDNKRIDLARLYSPKQRWWGEIRCDLHPRWRRDGKQICLDSVHSGERQMYVVNLAGMIK